MLVIHSLNPTGAFSYGESETLDIEKRGIINLKGRNKDSGGSNGSGKTSLFNVLCVLLFGENPTGVKDIDVPNALWDKGMSARCDFTSWEGIRYRITYCRDWSSSYSYYPADNDNQTSYVGTTLYLDKLVDHSWIDCRKKSMKETREEIIRVLGINYNNFLSTSYASSRSGNLFLKGTNKDRVDTLTRITGVDEWDTVIDKARAERRSLESQIIDIKMTLSDREASRREIQRQIDSFKEKDWDKRREHFLNELQGFREKYKEADDTVKKIENEIQELKTERNNSYSNEVINELNSKLTNKRNELNSLEGSLSSLVFIEDKNHPVFVELSNIQKEIYSKRGILSSIEGSDGAFLTMVNCPTCGAKVTKAKKESIEKKLKEIKKEIEVLNVSYAEKKVEWEGILEKGREIIFQRRKEVSDRINNVRDSIGEIQTDIQGHLNKYNNIDSVIEDKNRTIDHYKSQMSFFRSSGETKKAEIKKVEDYINSVKGLEERILVITKEIDKFNLEISEIQVEIDVNAWLIKNIPYIKLHKLSKSMDELSELVNGYLTNMGDTIRVNISSFDKKTKKKNAADIKDLLKSEVNVSIMDGDKKINPKLYSDGEISKISNALIRGLSELARKFGYGCNIMLLDEIFSFIDVDNSQKLSESFRRDILNRGTIFITDNSGSVDNLLSFDETWTAVKEKGRTKIERTEME